jgi:glycosyltransferase involved in cell wall biosynthesis
VEVNEDGTVGGSHQALYDLVKGLDRERFEPVVLFYQDNSFSDRLRDVGAEVYTFDEARKRERAVRRSGNPISKSLDILVGATLRRSRFLRQHRIDLVHLNNSPATGFDDWLPAARLNGIPCIASVMSVAPPNVGPIGRMLMRQFDLVLPVSRYILDDWARVGIPRERMRVVHHGIDLEAFRSRVTRSPEEVRAEFHVPPGHCLAVMVANVREWKGQHVVLEALGRLDHDTRGRLFTLFAGAWGDEDRDYYARLQELVKHHGLEGSVLLTGPRSDVADLLNAADIAIHASVTPEPGGIAVLEAMTVGTAVIAANVGGHAEVLTPESGLTFDTSSPGALACGLTQLIRDDGLRRSLGVKARERMEEFGIGRNVRETQDAYDGVLS